MNHQTKPLSSNSWATVRYLRKYSGRTRRFRVEEDEDVESEEEWSRQWRDSLSMSHILSNKFKNQWNLTTKILTTGHCFYLYILEGVSSSMLSTFDRIARLRAVLGTGLVGISIGCQIANSVVLNPEYHRVLISTWAPTHAIIKLNFTHHFSCQFALPLVISSDSM